MIKKFSISINDTKKFIIGITGYTKEFSWKITNRFHVFTKDRVAVYIGTCLPGGQYLLSVTHRIHSVVGTAVTRFIAWTSGKVEHTINSIHLLMRFPVNHAINAVQQIRLFAQKSRFAAALFLHKAIIINNSAVLSLVEMMKLKDLIVDPADGVTLLTLSDYSELTLAEMSYKSS